MLDGFLAKYRKGNIVYPSAVARYLGIAVEKCTNFWKGGAMYVLFLLSDVHFVAIL